MSAPNAIAEYNDAVNYYKSKYPDKTEEEIKEIIEEETIKHTEPY